LVRASSCDELLGRIMRDMFPTSMEPIFAYTLHREMLASACNSCTLWTILARMDGTVFKCVVNWSFFQDYENRHCQDLMSIHLDSVEDLPVPPLGKELPFKSAPLSLELDYPDSPTPCGEASE